MKNYFVQTLCKICANSGRPEENVPVFGDAYFFYKQLQEISYSSYRHFMQGEWEYVLLEKEVDHVFDVFKNNFQSIYNLRQTEPCNILYCDLDTQMIKPTEIFGKYDKFMMFNYTDPKSNSLFINNFNCAVRYYPAEMDQYLWDYTLQESNNLKVWEDEQDIYNDILWGQGVSLSQSLDPKMAFQAHMMSHPDDNVEYATQWNGIHINESHIIHWHGSRDLKNRICTMGKINQRSGVSQ